MPYFYISFATDEGCRGATVVYAGTPEEAIAETNRRSINPGGEAAILELQDEIKAPEVLAMMNRLVSVEELVAGGSEKLSDLPEETRNGIEDHAVAVCNECNTRNLH